MKELDYILYLLRLYSKSDGVAIVKSEDDTTEFLASEGNVPNSLMDNKPDEDQLDNQSIKIKKLNDQFKLVLVNPSEDNINDELLNKLKDLINSLTESSSENHLSKMLSNLDIIIYSTAVNQFDLEILGGAVKDVFGYDPANLKNQKFTLLRRIAKEDYPKVRKFLRDLKNGNSCTIEYRIIDDNGNLKYIRHSGIPVYENNEVIKIIGSIVDVTQEVKLREELKYSEEKFRMLIETANDLIFTLDKTGNFKMVNKNGALTLGYGVNELLGKHFLEFVTEESKPDVAVAFQNILKSKSPVTFEAHLIDNFGKEMIFEIFARSVGEKGLDGMIAIGRDVTRKRKDEKKLKDLNNKLIEANRLISIERDRAKEKITVLEELNKLKNDFISNVSHELRTPLASIVGFAEAISSDPEMPREMITEFNEIIYTEGKRLAKLINEILDFSKLDSDGEPLEKTEFNLIELIRNLADNFRKVAEEKGLTFNAEIPEAMITVNADRERISNALSNILSNAIKFTESGGRVTFIVNDFLKDVELIISDTGIGIPEKEIPNLFEKFKKVDRPGTQIPGAGLGLAATKKIIDLHNGLIRVKSEVNKGSTFIVRLPKKV